MLLKQLYRSWSTFKLKVKQRKSPTSVKVRFGAMKITQTPSGLPTSLIEHRQISKTCILDISTMYRYNLPEKRRAKHHFYRKGLIQIRRRYKSKKLNMACCPYKRVKEGSKSGQSNSKLPHFCYLCRKVSGFKLIFWIIKGIHYIASKFPPIQCIPCIRTTGDVGIFQEHLQVETIRWYDNSSRQERKKN
jgi:hypothetical protein